MIYKTPLSGRFCGRRHSYIYTIYSISNKLCYVGQTNDTVGIIGRLNGHLSNEGTFRNYFENISGIYLEDCDDLEIISQSLSDPHIFSTITSSYREGVEFLVKKFLMASIAKNNVFLRLVGETRPVSTITLNYIKTIAQKIALDIYIEIEKDYKKSLISK